MSNQTAITPSMCVAASDAAQELGIILPASHAGAVIEAALSASPTTQPADVSAVEAAFKHIGEFVIGTDMLPDDTQICIWCDGEDIGDDDDELSTLTLGDMRALAAARVTPAPMAELPETCTTAIRARIESRAIDFGIDFDQHGGDAAIDALYRAMVGHRPPQPDAALGEALLDAARSLPSLKGITLTSKDPMAQAKWLTALGDLQTAVERIDRTARQDGQTKGEGK